MNTPKLGDRVRIHLTDKPDELDAHWGEGFPCGPGGWMTVVIGHVRQQNGRTATVIECEGGFPCRFLGPLGHGYVVRYDKPYVYGDDTMHGGHFAASELEPA